MEFTPVFNSIPSVFTKDGNSPYKSEALHFRNNKGSINVNKTFWIVLRQILSSFLLFYNLVLKV